MDLEHRLIGVQSWWLASELLRRTPGLGIIETHPGGGTPTASQSFAGIQSHKRSPVSIGRARSTSETTPFPISPGRRIVRRQIATTA